MYVEATHVSKAFHRRQILSDISLSISENEIFGLIGPSGAGKTTLIRLLIGAASADEGDIRVGEHRMPSLEALREIGYMPQNDALYTDISGYDNLLFFGRMYPMKRAELRRRADEVLRLVELKHEGGKKVAAYSGGMKKRLSLAVAMLHEPRLLILDEPTVGIDPVLRKKIWQTFDALKSQGKTIIVTTHVMDEAVKCDRLGLIYGGKLIACDTVEALLGRTAGGSLEELFFTEGGNAQ